MEVHTALKAVSVIWKKHPVCCQWECDKCTECCYADSFASRNSCLEIHLKTANWYQRKCFLNNEMVFLDSYVFLWYVFIHLHSMDPHMAGRPLDTEIVKNNKTSPIKYINKN